ncbi:hypothetical protein UK23_46840 [Lentzea aerocolonigenes]|uniref:Uncharacterized protein n=1 Tax=Lentzea aerocolonigenes TaxID=68170 RepID=A0A0F0GFA9_LENAE|nr:hypothetical protein [Lentzea aerocolonigenes]KJK33264.1 hypothetical protein UK23_46840 [Lentzea aerocolonigenes]
MPGESPETVTITVDGHRTGLESLWDWLRHEPELRGRLRAVTPAAPDGAMGSGVELVVVASAPALDVLARSIPVWLAQRESGATVTIKAPDGRSVTATQDIDPAQPLRDLLGTG